MHIAQNIRLSRIFKNTWKVDIIMIITSIATYFFHATLIKYRYEVPVIVPTVLGTAIAFFIGFNNNQAYDRWWEGRKIWGMLVNDSRSWARGVLNYIHPSSSLDADIPYIKRRMIDRHIAFLYALKGALRNADDFVYKNYLSEQEQEELSRHTNLHNAILNLQSRELYRLKESGHVDGFEFIQLDSLLVKFSDEMGMAERIKNTVFPTTYNYFTKVFIWLFVVCLGLVLSQSLGIWSIFMSWLLGFVFVSTQVNGMSLINPFDNNSAAVPLNQITRTIEINLLQMVGEANIPEPVTPVNDEYVL